jgi:chondroitin sulfate synthase
MKVKSDFYLNSRAFARAGHSMYFPITFSRYNPELISAYIESQRLKTGEWLSRPSTVTVDTGTWRDFGFGMVSFSIGDAKAIGMYDAANEEWGYEDLDFFRRAQAAGYMNWRLYDTNIVHIYHSKTCDDIQEEDRFNMCLRSKLRMEGTKMQISLALYSLEQKLKQSRLAGAVLNQTVKKKLVSVP